MFFNNKHIKNAIDELSQIVPFAQAEIKGGKNYPSLKGNVNFVKLTNGILVISNIENLPETKTNIFGMHIHAGEECKGDFSSALEHLNLNNSLHPNHTGDLMPLFSNNGNAWSAVLYNKFDIEDILGKAIIIHNNPDDFKTQPGGEAGSRIACGIIKR